MTRKTYAARGLIDFQMALNVAGAVIRLCFSGGSMGVNGVISAKYTTDNPAIQKLIEKSEHFNEKRVVLYHVEKVIKEDTVTGKNNGQNHP